VLDGAVPQLTDRRWRRSGDLPSMRARHVLAAAAVVVLVGLVAATAVTVFPAVLALGLAVLALVAGVGARVRRRPLRRVAPTPTEVDADAPVAGSGGRQRLRWETSLDSGPSAQALPDIRARVAVVLAEWGLTGEPAEPALLVVTELLSNAIEHGRGPRRLSLELVDGAVRVEVRDDASRPPQLRPLEPLQARGRGLRVVEALSSGWGWDDDAPGKVVWAEVPTRWLV
jgi:anti-sigma regulatory factor (Ser/Thr protein kinase)